MWWYDIQIMVDELQLSCVVFFTRVKDLSNHNHKTFTITCRIMSSYISLQFCSISLKLEWIYSCDIWQVTTCGQFTEYSSVCLQLRSAFRHFGPHSLYRKSQLWKPVTVTITGLWLVDWNIQSMNKIKIRLLCRLKNFLYSKLELLFYTKKHLLLLDLNISYFIIHICMVLPQQYNYSANKIIQKIKWTTH